MFRHIFAINSRKISMIYTQSTHSISPTSANYYKVPRLLGMANGTESETRRDAEILVRNPSPRLFGKKFRDSKKVKTNHAKTRLRDLSKTLPRFRNPAKIFRDPCFSRYHSPPLLLCKIQFSLDQFSRHNDAIIFSHA